MRKALVITTIAGSDKNELQHYANKCRENNTRFLVVGDQKSPENFKLEGCEYLSLKQQLKLPFQLSRHLPLNHYSRKNIGYLQAISGNASLIIETDDDNFPMQAFWNEKSAVQTIPVIRNCGWVNMYKYFTKSTIWPRGFPLEMLKESENKIINHQTEEVFCPIQQALVNSNPDVDAVFRLTQPLPMNFEIVGKIALGGKSYCPFNSQNTSWFPEAFPLLYLPSFCSFRLTDIWRSFIAQRICREYGWHISFHSPTVTQERNDHNLLADFNDEINGYLYNHEICEKLDHLVLNPEINGIFENLISCYRLFIEMKLISEKELKLLNYWIEDFKRYFRG